MADVEFEEPQRVALYHQPPPKIMQVLINNFGLEENDAVKLLLIGSIVMVGVAVLYFYVSTRNVHTTPPDVERHQQIIAH